MARRPPPDRPGTAHRTSSTVTPGSLRVRPRTRRPWTPRRLGGELAKLTAAVVLGLALVVGFGFLLAGLVGVTLGGSWSSPKDARKVERADRALRAAAPAVRQVAARDGWRPTAPWVNLGCELDGSGDRQRALVQQVWHVSTGDLDAGADDVAVQLARRGWRSVGLDGEARVLVRRYDGVDVRARVTPHDDPAEDGVPAERYLTLTLQVPDDGCRQP